MQLIDKDLILNEILLFANLSGEERRLIKERSGIIEYRKGQVIYKEGSPPSAFYALAFGRVVVYTCDRSGEKTILEYLHRGRYFGIISLLTNEPHSVTVEAINDCRLLVIKKEDFDFVLKEVPRLAIGLSQALSRRLKSKDAHQKVIFESTIISVFSSYSKSGKSIYSLNLALALKKETRKSVIMLSIMDDDKVHSLPRKLEVDSSFEAGCESVIKLTDALFDDAKRCKDFIAKSKFGLDLLCCSYGTDEEDCLKRLVGILSLLVNDYHYLVLDLPSLMDRVTFGILNQSDLINILTSPEPVDLKRTRNLIERLKDEKDFQSEKIEVIINEYKLSKIAYSEQVSALGKDIFATLSKIDFETADRLVLDKPDDEYSRAVRRIARRFGSCRVGLALGVGMGYGFCHIGVLKVIEEEGIPVDMIAGSSIGALIASLWVTGKSSAEILEITREFRRPKHIWGLIDLTFPRLGFIKGRKLRKFLKRHLGDKTFYDVKIPLKIVASEVKTKELKILESGPLVDAVMASCSMPGVFTPFRLKEQMLFDGGVTSPLPTEPLFEAGMQKIIAVDVTPSREDILRQYKNLKRKSDASLPEKKKGSWLDFFRFNILDIIFSSIEVLQSKVARKEAEIADVILHPDTSGLYWLDLYRAEEFVKRGEEEARRKLKQIWRLVSDVAEEGGVEK